MMGAFTLIPHYSEQKHHNFGQLHSQPNLSNKEYDQIILSKSPSPSRHQYFDFYSREAN